MTIWPLDHAARFHCFSAGLAAALAGILPRGIPVLDLGCGKGSYLAQLAAEGFTCCGVEGTPGIREIADFSRIIEGDLARPLALDWPRSSVLCLEVGEHLLPEAEPQLWQTIDGCCDRRLILSWALPGQNGWGHHNCRAQAYVYDRAREIGFELLPRETLALRDAVDEGAPWLRQTILAFQRSSAGHSRERISFPGQEGVPQIDCRS